MRYTIRIEAYQVLDGAQVTLWIREISDLVEDPPEIVVRRAFTALELDCQSPERWARDLMVQVIEHL